MPGVHAVPPDIQPVATRPLVIKTTTIQIRPVLILSLFYPILFLSYPILVVLHINGPFKAVNEPFKRNTRQDNTLDQ